jgi:uncharacterized delta-60 repeat protein
MKTLRGGPPLARVIAGTISGNVNFRGLRKAALFLSLITLQAGGATAVRAESGLAGFDPNANLPVVAIVVQPDGKIVLGGSFTTLSPNGGAAVTRNHVARVNRDGSLDTTFNPNANLDVEAIAVQADGKVLVGGFFTTIGGVTWNRIARLNPDGTLDTTFNPNANGACRSIAMQGDGKILVGGDFTTLSPNGGAPVATGHLARLNSNGTLDTGFNPNANDRVNAIVVQADGKIVVGGRFNQSIGMPTIGGQTRNRIARLDATTGAADSFNPNASSLVVALAVQADGKILVGGDFNGTNSIGGAARNRIARLDPTTGVADSLDPSANFDVFTIVVQRNGMILAGGDFNGANSIGGAPRNNIARLDPVTGAADSFDPSASAQASVYAIALEADKVLVGGNFSHIGVQARSHIARVESDGTIPYFVNTTSDAVVAGACGHAAANCSLRGAIEAANAVSNSVISIAIPATDPFCSGGVCTINLGSALPSISAPMEIDGPGADKLTVRPASGLALRNFNVTATGVVTFFGLTISNATSGQSGQGGGISNSASGTVNVIQCAIDHNFDVSEGGGIQNHGILNVTNSTFSANTSATGSAGGILNRGTANITNSTFSGNSGGSGGGIANLGGTVNLTNSTISGNSVHGGPGGGIYNASGIFNVKSSLIAMNTSSVSNQGTDTGGSFVSAGFNLIREKDNGFGFTAATDQTGTVALPRDPKLDPNGLQNNGGSTKTIALLAGSPAIDKGSSNGLTGQLTTEQRGVGYVRRVDNPAIDNATGGDGVDIGAFEVGGRKISAVSRKTHASAGVFDIKLPVTGTLGVECRKGGSTHVFKVIVTFPSPVTASDATVSPDPAAPGATASVSGFNVSGSKVGVNLTGVSNAQTILITFVGVSDGSARNDVSIPMGVLLGDTDKNGSVTSTDVTLAQSKSGQPVDGTNFREDVTLDGIIGSSDVNLVQSKVGTGLP